MLDVPGPHFAISEFLIVGAAIFCGYTLGKMGNWLADCGAILFGLIAAIGAYRFGMGEIDAWADLHKAFSQVGGAIAMSLIAAQLALLGPVQRTYRRWVYAALLLGAVTAILVPSAALALFMAWLLIGILSAAFFPADRLRVRIFRAVLVGLFAFDIIVIRQSPVLGVGMSWHLFHLLVAIWLIGVLWVITGAQKQPNN